MSPSTEYTATATPSIGSYGTFDGEHGMTPKKATILVVDNSPEMLRYLQVLLELDSYAVITASSGYEALQFVHLGCVPDVILLDFQMPGMDGLETLRQLRQLRPSLNVIICSGVDDPEIVSQAAAYGAQGYLVKPVQHLYLSAAVGRCLQPNHAEPMERAAARVFVLPPPIA